MVAGFIAPARALYLGGAGVVQPFAMTVNFACPVFPKPEKEHA